MGFRNLFKLSVDGIIADIVLKIELLDVYAKQAQAKAVKKQQEISLELAKVAELAREGDRAVNIAGRLRQLVEG